MAGRFISVWATGVSEIALALFTTMSSEPKRVTVWAIAPLTAASSRTSTTSRRAWPPACSIASAAEWIVPSSLGCAVGLGRDRDIGAVAGGAQRDREPDAARSTGNEEGLAFERHRRHRLRAKNASKATFASGEFKRLLKILAS